MTLNSNHYCHLSFVNMRENPDEGSKVVSQSFFAEPIEVIKETLDWAQIMTSDRYLGWVKKGSYWPRKTPYKPEIETSRLFSHIYQKPDVEYGPLQTLPFGSKLQVSQDIDARWYEVLLPDDRFAFIQKGDVEQEPLDLSMLSQKFLGLPYTWGGRTSFGFDCSGFVQMVYRKMGIFLPRDAKEQILVGREVPIERLTPGDLIFWGKSEKQITHVALFLEKDRFIHTTTKENKPYLRISLLTDIEWKGSLNLPFRVARSYKV